MKKKILLFFNIFVCTFIVFPFDVEKKLKNTIVPITDISIERLWMAEKDDSSLEDFYYQQEIYKEENEYKEYLSTKISKNESIIGNWYLMDSKSTIVERNKNAPIHLSLISDGISYRCQSSTSYLYEIDKTSYIIIPTWDAGMIRMLRILDDRLYIYNLDGNTWYLDDIHKNGNYYKRK